MNFRAKNNHKSTRFCTLFEKSNFCQKIQFWQPLNIFTSFSPKKFFDNFSREIKVVNSEKVQNHNIFTSFYAKKSTIFSGNQSWIFEQRNEDFDQILIDISFYRRALFNWLHWFVGNSAQIVGIVAIFFAVDLDKAQLPRETDWLLTAFVIFHALIHIIMSCAMCKSDNR